jgi:hypothetical protein
MPGVHFLKIADYEVPSFTTRAPPNRIRRLCAAQPRHSRRHLPPDGAIVAMTHRDDIHTHDIAFDRSDLDPVEHRVSRFLGNTCQQRFESGQKPSV